jgi:hypothetical protein
MAIALIWIEEKGTRLISSSCVITIASRVRTCHRRRDDPILEVSRSTRHRQPSPDRSPLPAPSRPPPFGLSSLRLLAQYDLLALQVQWILLLCHQSCSRRLDPLQ